MGFNKGRAILLYNMADINLRLNTVYAVKTLKKPVKNRLFVEYAYVLL